MYTKVVCSSDFAESYSEGISYYDSCPSCGYSETRNWRKSEEAPVDTISSCDAAYGVYYTTCRNCQSVLRKEATLNDLGVNNYGTLNNLSVLSSNQIRDLGLSNSSTSINITTTTDGTSYSTTKRLDYGTQAPNGTTLEEIERTIWDIGPMRDRINSHEMGIAELKSLLEMLTTKLTSIEIELEEAKTKYPENDPRKFSIFED